MCLCDPSFSGVACERAAECLVNGALCSNGGSCVKGIAANHCECPQGYGGANCEEVPTTTTTTTVVPTTSTVAVAAPDLCAHVRCQNGGYCLLSNGQPTCACPASYSGTWCEKRAGACAMDPCQNGATCRDLGDIEGSFECVCPRGFSGNFCEDRTDVFQSLPTPTPEELAEVPPSTSSSSSTMTPTTTTSEMPETTTTTMITSTITSPTTTTTTSSVHQMHVIVPEAAPEVTCSQCVHSSRCVETDEGSVCVCKDGFVGPRCTQTTPSCSSLSCPSPSVCRRSSTLTSSKIVCGCPPGFGGSDCSLESAVSFSSQSLFVHQSPHVMIGSSSGPLPYEVSFSFRTTLKAVHIVSGEDLFGTKLYTVFLEDGQLTLNISSTAYVILSTRVNDGEWYEVALRKAEKDLLVSLSTDSRHLLTRPLPRPSSFDVFSTRLGKVSTSSNFVGCIADFVIDGEYRDMAALPRGVALTRGCLHHSPCASSPCGSGECIDNWDSFSCLCPPPLLPPLCKNALPLSTFGHENQISYAHLGIANGVASELKYSSSLSFLVRTRQKDAVLMVLGERVEPGDDARDLATFLSLEIRNGTMHGRARVGRKSIVDVDSETRVDDNEEHLVVLSREKSTLKISIDGVPRGEAQLESRFDYPLFTDSLLIGTANGSAHGAFTQENHFKGSLQDIRVNDLSAVLHPTSLEVKSVGSLQHSEGVLEGLISDDMCSSSPCGHGECSLLFNDFACTCEKGFTGRNCDQKDHCVSHGCPSGANCYSNTDGYTCSGPAHFVESSFADFALPTPIPVEKIEFSIRTNSESGHILTIDDFSLSLVEGRLQVGVGSAPFQLKQRLSTGQWRNVSVHKNVVRIDGQIYGIPRVSSLSHPASSAIRVGSTPSVGSFWGCIRGISIESSTPLSFLANQKTTTGWSAVRRHRIDSSGCRSVPQCGVADQCMNGGRCEDVWNKRVCHCPIGFTGEFCERELNECGSMHCGGGNCVDRRGEATCSCPPGYSGASCEVVDDPCDTHDKCANDGVCRRSNSSAAAWNCLCLPGHHGATCALEGSALCSPDNCAGRCASGSEGYSCECQEGWTGEKCEIAPSPCHSTPSLSPCGIHGICQPARDLISGYKCECLPGYTGSHCDSLLSSCSSSSCSSHGDCQPVLNGTLCHCIPPWAGPSCSLRVGGCSLVPCQNDGECVEESSGETSCKCRDFYLGDQCEVAGSCLSSPCLHGVCRQKTPTEHECRCEEGYRGERCEEEIDLCETTPCANGATCASSKGKFTCQCAPGFDGLLCDHDIDECLSSPCANGGKCVDRVADFECHCTENYGGRTCGEDVDECATVPSACVNGVCTNTPGSYQCACTMGYLGRRCTLRNPCVPDSSNRTLHMCVHGDCARPMVKSDGGKEWVDSECSCHPPYSGPTCATKMEESRLSLAYVVGPVIAVLIVLALLGCALLIFVLKGKGALQGHYSPSQQEDMGRYPMGTMLKLPPEERLI